jgi:hypothetical protein
MPPIGRAQPDCSATFVPALAPVHDDLEIDLASRLGLLLDSFQVFAHAVETPHGTPWVTTTDNSSLVERRLLSSSLTAGAFVFMYQIILDE